MEHSLLETLNVLGNRHVHASLHTSCYWLNGIFEYVGISYLSISQPSIAPSLGLPLSGWSLQRKGRDENWKKDNLLAMPDMWHLCGGSLGYQIRTDRIRRDGQQPNQCPSGDSSLSKLFLSKLFLASTGRSRHLASHSSSSTFEQIFAISSSSGLGGCWKPQKADFVSAWDCFGAFKSSDLPQAGLVLEGGCSTSMPSGIESSQAGLVLEGGCSTSMPVTFEASGLPLAGLVLEGGCSTSMPVTFEASGLPLAGLVLEGGCSTSMPVTFEASGLPLAGLVLEGGCSTSMPVTFEASGLPLAGLVLEGGCSTSMPVTFKASGFPLAGLVLEGGCSTSMPVTFEASDFEATSFHSSKPSFCSNVGWTLGDCKSTLAACEGSSVGAVPSSGILSSRSLIWRCSRTKDFEWESTLHFWESMTFSRFSSLLSESSFVFCILRCKQSISICMFFSNMLHLVNVFSACSVRAVSVFSACSVRAIAVFAVSSILSSTSPILDSKLLEMRLESLTDFSVPS